MRHRCPHFALAVVLCGTLTDRAPGQIAGSFDLAGEGCPNASLLYEQFAPRTFDLGGTAMGWFPNGTLGYLITSLPSGFLPFGNGLDLGMAANSISAPLNLGFTFPYPTGQRGTAQIEVSSNGYIYLEPGTIASSRCCNGNREVLDSFLRDTPSFALFGMNLDPGSGGRVWFDTAPGVAYVTWDAVPEALSSSLNTCQIQLFSDGRVQMEWRTVSNLGYTTLVGWSGGNGVDDDGPVDLSALLPFDMGPSSGPLTISAPRGVLPTTGQSFAIDVTNVPADAVAGAMLIGTAARNLDLSPLGMPDCFLLSNANIAAEALAITAPATTFSLTFPTTPGTAGLRVELQAATLAPSVNAFGLSTSNRGTLTVGDISPVIVRADGPDSFNDDRSSGFWQVINATSLSITSLTLDWSSAPAPNNRYVFDTNEGNMADRFDGGLSTTPLCIGTYRNGSDTTTGLAYTGSSTSPCDGRSLTGWTGAILTAPGTYRRLNFQFNGFGPAEVFEVDIDTDGGPSNGGAMAGLGVSVTLSDGTTRSGRLATVSTERSQVNL